MTTTRRGGHRRALPFVSLLAASLSIVCPARADSPMVRITTDTDGPTTRLVLTSSQAVEATVRASRGKIEIVYAEPVVVRPAEGRIDDEILSGWSLQGDRTIVLRTGPAYDSHEVFHLKNPTRLVLDLEGNRPGRGATSRGRGAPAPPSFVVVIDPGHGGAETGAVGPSGLEEKNVVLDLARRLKAALQEDGSTAVVLTRDEDRLVPLDERTAIANHNRADLFLSIHMNAARGRRAVGAETFFLAPEATDDETRTLAALENRAYEAPDAASTKAPETGAGIELILWDLAQNRYLDQSGRLAESVQAEMNGLAGTRDRGVRQAPFRVLMGATMPAVLVEAGLISNPEEESRFKSDEHKDKVVLALKRAVEQFRRVVAQADAPGGPPTAEIGR